MQITNSERLSFCLMSEKDKEQLYELDQDSEVMRFINGGKCTSYEEIENIYIPRMKSYTNANKGWGLWKVSLISNGDFLGWVLVRPMEFFSDSPQWNNLELGWRFKKDSWGQGYATEAAKHIKDALVRTGQVKLFSAVAFEENIASIKIMKKLGMSYLKTDIHRDPLGDEELVYYQVDLPSQ